MGDKLGTVESLFADVVSGADYAAPPRHPCPRCGRETKEHHPETLVDDSGTVVGQRARRICSHRACREVFHP